MKGWTTQKTFILKIKIFYHPLKTGFKNMQQMRTNNMQQMRTNLNNKSLSVTAKHSYQKS